MVKLFTKKIEKTKNLFTDKITDKNISSLVKKRVNRFLKALKSNYGNEVYVCLSGGLDSTIIAYLASKILKKLPQFLVQWLAQTIIKNI